jgi:chemotaxis protein methyltransferase CheR
VPIITLSSNTPPTDPFWSQETLEALVGRVRKVHGLDLAPFDRTFLAKALDRRAAVSAETALAYEERLARDFSETEKLLRSMHIGYSEFFRNSLAFALLEQLILPGLIDARKKSGRGEIRIWSAGCAAGQEAWSLAILLDALNRVRETPFSYRIIATDRFAPDLAEARAGLYSEEAVGNVRMTHLRRYFSRQGESFRIIPRLMDRVEFSVFDLLDEKTFCPPESIFGDFDLVYCSNVLLYYRQEAQALILGKMRTCLAPGGYLITDETEGRIVERTPGFSRVVSTAAIFMKDCHSLRREDECIRRMEI